MTPSLPFSLRFWLFLYGYPNIAGSALGLVGLALFFLGIIGPGWPYIVAGLYGLGWVLAWQLAPREMHLEIAREARAEALLGELENLIKRVHKHLPREAQVLLQSLRQTLAELLPRLADNTVFSQEGHTVEKTVRDYLPATLENYLHLPPAFARMHTLKDGKTAQSMLLDQLGLLDDQMRQMLANALRDDARALAENGAFLEQKFKPVDFFRLG
ncbi:MAG: hypothetical protein Q8O79_04965 [Pseudomonadota bacterium]|nr:hypothetical protein [Pseudomonadota bacterium]